MIGHGGLFSRAAWLGFGLTIGLLVLMCLPNVLAVTAVPVGAAMEPRVVEQPEFSVIGIQVRTSNAKEMTAGGAIPKQWAKFLKEGIADKIPNKMDSTIYAVYTGYASHRDGEYDFVIGMKVSSISDVPPGMVAKKVPSGRYAIVTSVKGPAAQVVPQAWQRVWTLEDNKQLGGARSYKADFEVYDQQSQNPQDSQVDLYIGLK
jgi:predicted transcriptional regulator YdeE